MDGAEALRIARRRLGCSQRELALRAQVSASTVAAIESGERAASLPTMAALLETADLELTVDLLAPPVSAPRRAYLHLPLPVRVRVAFGGQGQPAYPSHRPWSQVMRLSAFGQVSLSAPLAVGVWLGGLDAPQVWEVTFTQLRSGTVPATPDLVVVHSAQTLSAAVDTGLGAPWAIRVPAPAELALDPACAEHRLSLRAVARLLHEEPCLDDGSRRVPAHRDPQHQAEALRIIHTKRWARQAPPGKALRSWRLQDAASMKAWLRSLHYPD